MAPLAPLATLMRTAVLDSQPATISVVLHSCCSENYTEQR